MRSFTKTCVFAALSLSCNNNKFKESAGPQGNPTPVQQGQDHSLPQTQGGQVVLPPQPTSGCNTAGTTAVKLLTDAVVNKAPNQIIKYELSMNDCQGVQTPITASEIKFDLNSYYVGATIGHPGPPLPFTLQGLDGAQLSSGSLNVVLGTDLFGNSSVGHWHYKTNTPINVSNGIKQVVLSVDISNSENHLVANPAAGSLPPTEVISTFLSFGNAKPVEQPVTFKN